MADDLYIDEKLGLATHALAAGIGRIQDRLYSAMLECVMLSERDFTDPDLKGRWQSIRQRVTSVSDREKGDLRATLDQMDDEAAAQVARDILDLHAMIETQIELED